MPTATTAIDTYIQTFEDVSAKREDDRRQQIDRQAREAAAAAQQLITEAGFQTFFDAIQSHAGDWKTHTGLGGSFTHVALHVPTIKQLQIAEFYIVYDPQHQTLLFDTNDQRRPSGSGPHFTISFNTHNDNEYQAELGKFLEARRTQWERLQEEEENRAERERKHKIASIKDKLNSYQIQDPDVARAAFEELQALGVDLDVEEKMEAWRAFHAEKQKEQLAATKRKQQKEAYKKALIAWKEELDAVASRNADTLLEYQDQYDEPRTVWELYFGAISPDGPHTRVEIYSTICLNEPPMHQGPINVIVAAGAGKIEERLVYYPSYFRTRETRPTEREAFAIVRTNAGLLYVDIEANTSAIRRRVEADLEERPPKPEPGDLLSDSQVNNIEHHVLYAY